MRIGGAGLGVTESGTRVYKNGKEIQGYWTASYYITLTTTHEIDVSFISFLQVRREIQKD